MDYKDSEILNRSFRILLIELRKRHFYTQTALSKSVGISRQAISMMESGKRVASFQTFCELAQGMGLSPSSLMSKLEIICEMEYRVTRKGAENVSMAQEYIRNTRATPRKRVL